MKVFIKKIFNKVTDLIYKVSGNFTSISVRPIYSKNVVLTPMDFITPRKTAIIIQGPLKHELSFTLETVRLYKKTLSPATEIIVSTWNTEDQFVLEQIRHAGAHVVTSLQPQNRGILNINLQITSVVAALQKCEELGVDFVFKTRTDTRVYAPNIESYLFGMLQSFPPASKYTQKYRILGFSLNTYMYRLYSLSDIVMFGHIDDMKKYWGVSLDTRTAEPANASTSIRAWSQARMVETYLTAAYLENIGKTLEWTLNDSFCSLAENFIIVDEQSVDLYWYKYESWREYRNRNYTVNKNNVFITFRDWMTLYNNQTNFGTLPESILDTPFKEKIL